ncbi:MAG: diguanylate cyclase [Anaerolineaceae bacterium]|nr:diguanylate cyclase [Anaerolineaceae bacterium]
MVLNQYSIFFILSLLAAGLSVYLAVYAFTKRPARGATTFAYLSLTIAVWTFAIPMGMIAPNEEMNFFWAVIRMIAVIIIPVFWLILAIKFSDRTNLLKTSNIIFWMIIPALSILLMVTTRQHQLFISEIKIISVGDNLIDEAWFFGPWFWIHTAYSYTLILVGDFILIKNAIRMPQQYRLQAVFLILGTTLPLLINIAFVFALIPGLEVNYDPIGFVLATICFYIGLFRYRMFDLKPIARSLLISNMRDGMLVIDPDHRIVDWNPSVREILENLTDQAIGLSIEEILPDFKNYFNENNSSGSIEIPIRRQNLELIFDIKSSPVMKTGQLLGHLLIFRDITQRKEMENKLESLAISDSITGLFNHRYFYEMGAQELERAKRYQKDFVILFFDIDNFKTINDTYGHLNGDMVLKIISENCGNQLRETDIFARYGGDEFAVILSETSTEEALQAAERLRIAVEEKIIGIEQGSFQVTISIGLTEFDAKNDKKIGDLIQRADEALYNSKARGKNCVSIVSKT